jgi:hypothetical protein
MIDQSLEELAKLITRLDNNPVKPVIVNFRVFINKFKVLFTLDGFEQQGLLTAVF